MRGRCLPTWALLGFVVAAGSAETQLAFALATTDQVASPGQPVAETTAEKLAWPEGTLELVNNPLRTTGWEPWINGVSGPAQHYLINVKTVDDTNRLIRKLAAVKSETLCLVLQPGNEVRSVPYVQTFRVGEGAGAVFMVGSWIYLDEQRRAMSAAGRTTTLNSKVAPPTLKLYCGSGAVELAKLEIPDKIAVTLGYEPPPEDVERARNTGATPTIPETLQPRAIAIQEFVKQHNAKRGASARGVPMDVHWERTAEEVWKKYVAVKRMDSEYIPASCWNDEIRRLDPIYVYQHHTNIVVVQKRIGDREREVGIYIINPLASTSSDDGFTLLPAGQKGAAPFVRMRRSEKSQWLRSD